MKKRARKKARKADAAGRDVVVIDDDTPPSSPVLNLLGDFPPPPFQRANNTFTCPACNEPVEGLAACSNCDNGPVPDTAPSQLGRTSTEPRQPFGAKLHLDIMCHTSLKGLGAAADCLKGELANYQAAAMSMPAGSDLCLFWRTHKTTFPMFNIAARVAATIQPSSAAAERVFAMLKWMFSKGQSRTNEDYKMLALILRYNEMWRLKIQKLKAN